MRGRSIRPNEGTRIPCSHVALDTETLPVTDAAGVQHHRFSLGTAIYWRTEGGRVVSRDEVVYTSIREFWVWLDRHASRQRPTWIWAHNAMFDWTVLRLWDRIDSGYLTLDWAALESPPFIAVGAIDGCRVVLCDTLNWFRCRLEQLGQWTGLPKLPMPGEAASLDDWAAYCMRDTEIVVATVQAICLMVRELDLGNMRWTMPGQSHAHWRHTHMHHTVVPPPEGPESRLARAAYYGGRTEVFFRGRVRAPLLTDFLPNPQGLYALPQLDAAPVYACDTNSMYGSVLLDSHLPVRCTDYTECATVSDLVRALKHGHVIADVDIDTPVPMPIRVEGVGTVYAVGRFRTQLASPELRCVLDEGRVTEVHRVAAYATGLIASFFAEYWLGRRAEYRRAGDTVMEEFAKGMLNSWYGRWGMQRSEWEEVDEVPVVRWGDWIERERWRDKAVRHYRARYGILERECEEGETSTSFPAIAGCVTAIARDRMSHICRVAGERCVVYQCVDCVHLIHGGYSRLLAAGLIDPARPGALRPGAILDDVTYYGLGMRVEDGRVVAPGLPSHAVPVAEGVYRALDFEGPAAILGRIPDGTVRVTPIRISPSTHYRHRKITESGWTIPLRLPEDWPAESLPPATIRRPPDVE